MRALPRAASRCKSGSASSISGSGIIWINALIPVQIRADLSKLDDAELAEYERLANKACAQTIDVAPAALPPAPDEQVSTGDQIQERDGESTLLASVEASGEE